MADDLHRLLFDHMHEAMLLGERGEASGEMASAYALRAADAVREHLRTADPVDRATHVRHMVLAAVARGVEVGHDTPSLEARQAAVDAIVDSTVRALADVPEPVYGTPEPAEPVRADDTLQARVAALNAAARIVAASIGRAVPERQGGYPHPYSTGVAATVTGLADTLLRWVAPEQTEDQR